MTSRAAASTQVEPRVQELGRELLAEARRRRSWWSRFTQEDVLIERLMGDDRVRVAALRFVDVLPALRRDRELTRHLEEYFGDDDLPLPWPAPTHWGLRAARIGIAAHVIAPVVRAVAGRMAKRFIVADSIRSATDRLRRLHRKGMGFTLDVLGAAVLSDSETQRYAQQYLALLEGLDPVVRRWKPNETLDRISGRQAPRLNLSLKVSALYCHLHPVAPQHAIAHIADRLRPIFTEARRRGAFITIDMEHYDTKDITIEVFKRVLSEPQFADWPDVGLAIQAYLRDTPRDLAGLIDWAKRRGTPVMIRLVRGAYWDFETIHAREQGWSIPVWTEKSQTDRCYEDCLTMLFDAYPHVETAVATHNLRSLCLAMALAESRDLSPTQYELQMLYGMADEMKGQLVDAGQRLRVYAPFGELIPGMAYLVRRLLENSDSQSFLRMGFAGDVKPEQALAPPPKDACDTPPPPVARCTKEHYVNEPIRRFTDESERSALAAALEAVRGQLGRDYPMIIAGKPRETATTLDSVNPAEPSVIVRTASASAADVADAIAAAKAAYPAWADTDIAERAEVLRRAAKLMRDRKDELCAWEIFEAAKPWIEADADIAEAIDFCEYYAAEAEKLWAGHAFDAPGETNRYFYEPRGVGAVIAPWNFPLAIVCGMAAAPIVCGNTIVCKPAPQTPVIAAIFTQIMEEAGLPPGVLNFVPGADEAGKALVAHPDISFINFTGSQAAGCAINLAAAEIKPGQDHLKHVVAEMGGKNAIIVDADADLDDAIAGVAYSVYGFAGQKCSACSRAIIVGDQYETFIERFAEAARSQVVGKPEDPATMVNPVIDAEAHQRIHKTIDEAAKTAKLVLKVDTSALGDGDFVGPTVFRDVDPKSDLAQNEIFGPVLAIMKAKSFDEALEIALGVRYALTGGVFSRSPANLEKARRRFRVGNLYLNRKCTGALVGRQPFGGMKMSGTNAKAGGPDHLLHFVEARSVTENTMRQGFAPEE